MIKLIIFFLIPLHAFAWYAPESFNSSYIEIEDAIFKETITGGVKDAKGYLSSSTLKKIFNDKENRVSNKFDIPKYFEASVRFWFSIYTQFSSEQVVIHDKGNLELIYKTLDFTELHSNESIHRFSKSKLQSTLSLEYTRKVKKTLQKFAKYSFKRLFETNSEILTTLKDANINLPKNKKKRAKLFYDLARNIRTQTGQRNKILKGVIRSSAYLPFLYKQLKNFRLPKEILAIPFLESSFNPIAESKAAAAGLWQFIPYANNLFMPKITNRIDYRFNPIVASLAAFHLIKENKLILRRWDLAIPAYNSGPTHLKKAIRKFSKKKKRNQISLEYILTHYKHPHIGFASKNFYAEFLALTRVLAYKELIYPLKGYELSDTFTDVENLGVYLSRCKIKPNRFFTKMLKTSPSIIKINSHFKNITSKYPKGTIVVSDRKLSSSRFQKLSDKQLKDSFPKYYFKSLKSKACN